MYFIVTITLRDFIYHLFIDRDELIGTDSPGASQRNVSGDESLASILLMRSLGASWPPLASPLTAPSKLAQIEAYTYSTSFKHRVSN